MCCRMCVGACCEERCDFLFHVHAGRVWSPFIRSCGIQRRGKWLIEVVFRGCRKTDETFRFMCAAFVKFSRVSV